MVSALVGGALALGSAIYGGVASSIANNKSRRLIQQQRDDNRAWYNTQMSQDYTQRADVQAAIKRQRELLNEQYSRARATQVVSGGTDEGVALQKQAANKSLSDTMTDIAAAGARHKDAVEQQYRAQDAALNQQQAQSYQQQAGQTAQAASQAVNAGLNVMGNELALGSSTPTGTPVTQQQQAAQMQKITDAETLARAQAGLDNTIVSQIRPGEIPIPKRKVNA